MWTRIGTADGPHTIYWHCIDFMHAVLVALCDDGVDAEGWAAVCQIESEVRAGLFAAIPRRYDGAVQTNGTPDEDRALSAAIIASHLPKRTACSRNTAPTCVTM